MGMFRTTIEVENLRVPGIGRELRDMVVDTGSEYTWIPRQTLRELGIGVQRQTGVILGDGRRIERDLGYALVKAGGTEAPELVVFAEPGDMVVLGAHSLEGLNLKVDPVRKALIWSGPVHG